MTYKTHRRFSVSFGLITMMILYTVGFTSINYYLALIIILQMSKYGALFPDVDHDWQFVKEKTVPNWIINKLIHLTGGKHRSWQTHSIDIVVIATLISIYLPNYLYNNYNIGIVNKELLSIIMIGFSSGWISHTISDMLTSEGERLVCWSDYKIAFVPKKILWIHFKTGEGWEGFCCGIMKLVNIAIGLISIAYPFIIGKL